MMGSPTTMTFTGAINSDGRGFRGFTITWEAGLNRIYVNSKRYTRRQARKRFGLKIGRRGMRVRLERLP